MKSLNHVHVFTVAVALLIATVLIAKEPQKKERFVPNYIAIDDVPLSTPNGNSLGSLKKGTLVAARWMGDVLDVEAKDGNCGLADSNFFSRRGSSINITKDTKQVAESSNSGDSRSLAPMPVVTANPPR